MSSCDGSQRTSQPDLEGPSVESDTAPENASWIKRRGVYAFLKELEGTYGWRLLAALGCGYLITKGILYRFAIRSLLPYVKDYLGLDGIIYQKYAAVAYTPYSVKGLLGNASDFRPFFGYHKTPYLAVGTVLGIICATCLWLLPLHQFAMGAGALVFGLHMQMANTDILLEGHYARKINENPAQGTSMVTWVTATMMVGTIIGSVVVGFLADHLSPPALFGICAPLAGTFLVPLTLGWLGERKVSPVDNRFRSDLVRHHPKIVAFSVAMAAVSVGLAAVNLAASENVTLGYSCLASVLIACVCLLSLPKTMGRAMLYLFIANITYLDTSGGLDYWYMANQECVPGGPHFSYSYYVSISGTVGAIAGLFASVLFQVIFKKSPYRFAFWFTTFLKILGSGFDVIILKRWNIAAGIPDKLAYFFGDAIIYPIVQWLDWMPSIVLLSKLCPSGLEATVFALGAGMSNFATSVAMTLGSSALKAAKIRTNPEEGCDFSNLYLLVIFSHMLLPLLSIPLTFVLIPDARLSDSLERECEWDTPVPPSDLSSKLSDQSCVEMDEQTSD